MNIFRKWICQVAAALALAFSITPASVNGQVGTAQLKGVVADASGGVIPNAAITLDSATQKFTRETITDSNGEYLILAIPPGDFNLTVKASGFRAEKRTNISLSSGQASTLSVSLAVATTNEEVTVTDAPPLLQTSNATLGTVVESKQLEELPLLGRNFINLMLILPGAAPVPSPDGADRFSFTPRGGNMGFSPSMYGQRQRNNNYTLDGVTNSDILFNSVGIYPPPEAIAEMKIESGMSSGAYGFSSGANVDVVSKSGSKDYHGDLWESFRNNALDARGFFLPMLGAFRWNQFGFAGGGPLQIPRVLSKERGWYLYGFYEGIRLRQASNFQALVPTTRELGGDFSGGGDPIFNPFTTAARPDGSLAREPFPGNQIPTSLLNSSASALAKALYPVPNLLPGVIPGRNYLNTAPRKQNGNQYSLRLDHQFSVKDNFFARYSVASQTITNIGLPAVTTQGIKRFDNMVIGHTHIFSPSFLITGRFGSSRANDRSDIISGSEVAKAAGTFGAWPIRVNELDRIPPVVIPGYAGLSQGFSILGPVWNSNWMVDAHKTIGRHTLEIGLAIANNKFITNNLTGTQVAFASTQTSNFVGATGNALASFVVGLPEAAGRVIGNTAGNMHGNTYGIYFQDVLRATRKLTFNLGLRWDYASPMLNKNGSGTFIWETGQYVWSLTNPITNEAPTISPGAIDPDRNNFQPRFGIAYELTSKTVIRSSFAIFFDTYGNNYAQTQQGNRGNWPFAFPQTVTALNRSTPSAFLQNPFPGLAAGSRIPLGCQQCLNVVRSSSRTPYVEQWTLSVQRQVTTSFLIETAYFGSHALKQSGQIIDNTAVTPGAGPVSARQRHPQFPAYVLNGVNIFPSWYNGLSVKLEKRYSNNLHFLVSYTWSKTINFLDSFVNGGLGGQPFSNPTRFNIRANKAVAGYDVPQRLVVSYIYQVPVQTRSRMMNALVSNWSIAGNVSFDSGLPFVPLLSSDNENIGVVPGRNTQFPDVTGSTIESSPTAARWFNTSAFRLPSFGTIGNAGRLALRGDGFANMDLSLFKRWPFKENRFVEVRGEFFNALNNVNFGYPGGLFGTPQFGKVSSQRNAGRQVQLTVKIGF